MIATLACILLMIGVVSAILVSALKQIRTLSLRARRFLTYGLPAWLLSGTLLIYLVIGAPRLVDIL